ncbi:MAG TPA: phosphoribosylaminoimidazolesuccinocarboxamide synthase [Myxococcota bacterium]|nr:phosphoribosylaminoimidazolesuccinocarboxamide synthase [Myxococcota bacterium]
MLDASHLTSTLERADLQLAGLGPCQRGKVRDAWPLGDGRRLIVTTDRVSAFDRVLGTIPFKGQVLNLLSAWWFERTADLIPNHLLGVPHPNAMIVREAVPLPIEVVVRGFITGVTSTSLWTLYERGERPYGLDLPPGLRKNDRLPTPVVTPTTKAQTGHDRPTTAIELIASGMISAELWREVESRALALFVRGQSIAEARGLLLVDTKYELGLVDGRLTLIDEVHTPDSSRYWLADSWHQRDPEHPPIHLDKERLRFALAALGYRGDGPPPPLPDALRLELAERYLELYQRLTGAPLPLQTRPLASLVV